MTSADRDSLSVFVYRCRMCGETFARGEAMSTRGAAEEMIRAASGRESQAQRLVIHLFCGADSGRKFVWGEVGIAEMVGMTAVKNAES